MLKALKEGVGFKGPQAQQICESIRNIQVPYDAAVQVFKEKTLPKYIKKAKDIFPGIQDLKPEVYGALVSLLITTRALTNPEIEALPEIQNIKNAISGKTQVVEDTHRFVAEQVRKMKKYEKGDDAMENM